jgi:hypothetical protein
MGYESHWVSQVKDRGQLPQKNFSASTRTTSTLKFLSSSRASPWIHDS